LTVLPIWNGSGKLLAIRQMFCRDCGVVTEAPSIQSGEMCFERIPRFAVPFWQEGY
jgi:hypothetical protein